MVVFLFVFSSLTSNRMRVSLNSSIFLSCLSWRQVQMCEQLAQCCRVLVLGWKSNLLFGCLPDTLTLYFQTPSS